MRSFILIFTLVLAAHYIVAQQFATQDPAYIEAVTAGEKALIAEDYESCISHYKSAFEIRQTSYLSTMRAAACAHSANDIVLRDQYFDKAFEISPDGSKSVFKDYDEFRYLDGSAFEEAIEERFLAAFPNYNQELAGRLAEVLRTDQEQRQFMREVSDKHGWESPQMDSLWVIQNHSDSVNTIYITQLIDKIGYPGKSVVGDQASTAFLVIQHADLEIQERYLPVLREAADAGEMRWSSLALLIDRIEIRNDRPQIYGSQVNHDKETGEYFFAEIKNPHKVDEVRASVGLGPLQEYANYYDFTFDPDKHAARYKKKD